MGSSNQKPDLGRDNTPSQNTESVAEALRNLRLGKATPEQQKLASRYLGGKIGSLNDVVSKLEKNRKRSLKEWKKWQRMELVYDLVNNPSMDGRVDDVQPSSHNQAYILVAELEGVSKDTIRRDYEILKAEYGEEGLRKIIDENIARLWIEAIRGK